MTTRHASPLRIIQISDTHLGAERGSRLWGVDVGEGLDAVLRRLQERHWPADFILATGDLVQDEGKPAYERLRAALAHLGAPVYCLPGNHDNPAVLAEVLGQGPVRLERHVIAGAWQFVLLDSTLPGSPAGHLAEAELAFLEGVLAAYPDHHAMVCLHHQPLPVGSVWLDTMAVDNADALFAVLDRHPQVRAVVWGHVHQEFAGYRRGVALLGAPSTCVQFKPGLATPAPDDLAPGYRWFELHPDGVLATGVERTVAVQ